MLTKKDQKKLQILYESIANTQELLKTEEKYIEITAQNIVNQMYKNIENRKELKGTERLGNVIFSQFLDIITFDNVFKVDKEQKEAVKFVFEFSIIGGLYHDIVLVSKEFVMFRDLSYLSNNDNNQLTKVPYNNKQEVLEKVKTAFKDLILYYYKLFSDPKTHKLSHKWYLWRKQQINYKHLTNRLPELEGLF